MDSTDVKIFLSTDHYFNSFKMVDIIYKIKQDAIDIFIERMKSKYKDIFQENEFSCIGFSIPNKSKSKKKSKTKRTLSVSKMQRSLNKTYEIETASSRKTPNHSKIKKSDLKNEIRTARNILKENTFCSSEETVCTEKMENPLGFSTPKKSCIENDMVIKKEKESIGFPKFSSGQVATVKQSPILVSSTNNESKILTEKNNTSVPIKETVNFKKTVISNSKPVGITMKEEKHTQKTINQKDITGNGKLKINEKMKIQKLEVRMNTPICFKNKVPAFRENMKNENDTKERKIQYLSETNGGYEEKTANNRSPTWSKVKLQDSPFRVQSWVNKNEIIYNWFGNKHLKKPALETLFPEKIQIPPDKSSSA